MHSATMDDAQSDTYSASAYGSMYIDKLHVPIRTPNYVYILVTLSAIGGFLFGYDTGVVSGAMIYLREQFDLSSVWQEGVVAVTVAGAAAFALVAGIINDVVGRKVVVLLASLVFAGGSLCLAFSSDRYMLLVGRLVVGAGIGMTSMTTPMYIAECSPAHMRGRLVSTHVVMIAAGQLVANIVSGIFSLVGKEGWRYMLGLGAVPAILQFLGFLFMPESPRFLIVKGKVDDARLVLQKIRGEADIDEEFDLIRQNCLESEREHEAHKQETIIWQIIKNPSTRRALILGCMLQAVQQLAGINTVMYYTATIIKMSGVTSDVAAIWLSTVTAGVNLLFTVIGLYLVERVGRRPLTLGSLIGVIISLAWLATGFNITAANSAPITMSEALTPMSTCHKHTSCTGCIMDFDCGFCFNENSAGMIGNTSCLSSDYDSPALSMVGRCNSTSLPQGLNWAYDFCPTYYAWVPMAGIVMYLMFFAPGMGPMPWTINTEIYPLWARSTGISIATSVNWIFNLIISMSFLSLTESITRYGTFWLFACLATAGLIFFLMYLPETKGKNLEEVEGLFAQPWFGARAQTQNPFAEKSVHYVHIRGLNRDESEDHDDDSP